ncbi:MAG: PAS domain S-box protein [Calothrix sp. C42_A2020_038]|nr:PAS domain S-box protein [Calothrix sp. C42_A2020_038]
MRSLSIFFYIFALISVALALMLMLILSLFVDLSDSPFLLFPGAVILSSWYGGIRVGLVATSLAAIASRYFFIFPIYSFNLDIPNSIRLGIFISEGILISFSCQMLRNATVRANETLHKLKVTENMLEQRKQQELNILESITDGFFALDREWRFTYMNSLARGILQDSLESVLGKSIWEMCPLLVGTEFEKKYRQAMETQVSVTFEAAITVPNEIWYQVHAYPFQEGLAVYFRNITEQKQIESALRSSEKRLANLASNIPGIIFQYYQGVNNCNQFTYISSGCLELCEIESNKIQTNPSLIWRAIHPHDIKAFRKSLKSELNPQWHYQWRFITPSGKIKWVQANARCNRQPDGSRFWDGVLLDITESKRNESRFRYIFDSNMIGISFFSQDGEIIQANKAYLDIIGYTTEDIQIGRIRKQDITPPEHRFKYEQAKQEILLRGVCTPYEKEYIRKDGSHVSVLVGAASFDNFQEGGVCFVADLSASKQLEKQLRQHAIELEYANRAKDEFLGIVSHELRTPLNSILGFAQMLQRKKLTEQNQAIAIETIERNAHKQKQLVEDLLIFSRILQGKLHLVSCPMNLVNTIKIVINSLNKAANQKSIDLKFEILDFKPVDICHDSIESKSYLPISMIQSDINSQLWIEGDSMRLQQAISNLVENAIKFTPKDGEVKINLSIVEERNEFLQSIYYAQIQVIDNGIGINPEFLPYVFDVFRQADSSKTRKFSGLGLGLAIVDNIVKMHGGKVYVDSPGEGQGATFTIKLPIKLNDKHPAPVNRDITALKYN